MAASELMSFCATEFQGFFLHIGTAIKQFHEHGSLPPAAFQSSTASGLAGKADKKPKIKRKAVAYNIFVKEKMEQLKASGLKLDGDKNNNELFKLAVSEWKKLTDAERKQYTEKFKGEQGEDEEMDEAEADLLPDPSTSAVSPQLAQDGNPESVGAGNKRKADDGGMDGTPVCNGDKAKKKRKKDKKMKDVAVQQ